MTTYYISPNGSDANNGLGPDASHATNKPWLTIRKAMHTGSTVVPGDTIYVAPGIYYEAASTTPAGISSAASPTALRGDPANAQGFKDGSGVRLAPGVCFWTRRTVGEGLDTRLASTGNLITASTNGTKGIQIYNMVMEAGDGQTMILLDLATNTDWLVQDCRFLTAINVFSCAATSIPTAGLNLTIRGCDGNAINLTSFACTVAAATADANMNVLIESCWMNGRPMANSTSLGTSGGNKAGGWTLRSNTFIGSQGTNHVTTANVSTVAPIVLADNLMLGNIAVSAGAVGQVTSVGGNRFCTANADTNFTLDGTDVRGSAAMLTWPNNVKWGLSAPSEPPFSWGAGSIIQQYNGGFQTGYADFRGRTVRPWGTSASPGAFESGHLSQDTSSAISGGGVNSAKIVGAGEIDGYFIPIEAGAAITITVKYKTSSYGGTNWPQLIAEAVPSAGVTQQTATGTSGAEQTLTIGPFTPTANAWMELRFISRSSDSASITNFDLVAKAVA